MPENPARKLSIIIPVFNEQVTVGSTIEKVLAAKLPNSWQKEVVVVDDGSTDGTRDILEKYESKCKVVFRYENGGKGAALKSGFKVATGDYILIQDADSEYDPNDYAKLLAPIDRSNSEVVFGSRVLARNNVPFSRVYFYGGLVITKIFNLLFGNGITDLATCYKVFPEKYVPELLNMPSDGFVFDVVELSYVLLRKVGHITEVPISYHSRHKEEGKKMNWRHGWWCFRRIVSLFLSEKSKKAWLFIKKSYNTCSYFINSKGYMPVFLTFSLFFAVFFFMYFSVSTLSSSDDHYFHFRFAQEMWQNGFFHSFTDFKSIYLSKMAQGNAYFVYYNFLFYLIAIPFTFLNPLYLGIKLYAVFAVALAFALLYWCLKKFEIKNPFIWILLIISITNTGSIWRFFLSRPYALAPSLLLLLLVFLYKKNYIGIFILSFIYLYWHSATFFMPFGVTVVYFIIEWFYREKKDYKILTASFIGTGIAFVLIYIVSSGFLLYMKDIIFGTYWETILGKKVPIGEGGELYPIDFFNFIQGNALIFASFITAISVDVFSYTAFKLKKVMPSEYFMDFPASRRYLQTSAFVLTAIFFLGTIVASGRFGDYFTMFAGLYIALSFDYMFRSIKISGSVIMRKGIITGLAIVLAYLFFSNIIFLQQKLAIGSHATEMYQVGIWLNNNSDKEVVFITNWSWFPQLYYSDPNDYYISGLEPRFTYVYSPRLYWLWTHISQDGYVCDVQECKEIEDRSREAFKQSKTSLAWAKEQGDEIAAILLDDFNSKIIITSRDYLTLNFILSHNNHFEHKLYNAEYGYSIYTVKKDVATSTKSI